jgi:hypothetical protein
LELPDREELKGLEGPKLEKSAMAGGSEAAAAPKGGGAARVWKSRRRRCQGGAAVARLVLGLGSVFRLISCREIIGDCTASIRPVVTYIYRRHTDYNP